MNNSDKEKQQEAKEAILLTPQLQDASGEQIKTIDFFTDEHAPVIDNIPGGLKHYKKKAWKN